MVVLSREGRIATRDLEAPWAERSAGDLKKAIGNAHCRAGRCVVTHPGDDAISIVAASKLTEATTVALDAGSDPRDVAFVDDHTAIISQRNKASLVQVDLVTHAKASIDLAALSDGDGLPEATRMSACGRRVYVQLERVDHETGLPSAIPAVLGVVDMDAPSGPALVDLDPTTEGVQGVILADRPAFDMPVDCAGGLLYVAEPKPLFKGGGSYEVVNLATGKASEYAVDIGAEVGGFAVLTPSSYWLITHTDTGPGASSHLTFSGGGTTYNTFAGEHVDDLALDTESGQLFFPDPCNTVSFPSCKGGLHVFGATTGEETKTIDVGFAPIEVTISR